MVNTFMFVLSALMLMGIVMSYLHFADGDEEVGVICAYVWLVMGIVLAITVIIKYFLIMG